MAIPRIPLDKRILFCERSPARVNQATLVTVHEGVDEKVCEQEANFHDIIMFTLRPSHVDEITYLLFEEVKHRQSEWRALSRAQRVTQPSRFWTKPPAPVGAQSQTLIQGTSTARITHHPPLAMLVPNLRYLENAAERTVLDLNVRLFCLGDTTGGVPLRGFELWSFRSV